MMTPKKYTLEEIQEVAKKLTHRTIPLRAGEMLLQLLSENAELQQKYNDLVSSERDSSRDVLYAQNKRLRKENAELRERHSAVQQIAELFYDTEEQTIVVREDFFSALSEEIIPLCRYPSKFPLVADTIQCNQLLIKKTHYPLPAPEERERAGEIRMRIEDLAGNSDDWDCVRCGQKCVGGACGDIFVKKGELCGEYPLCTDCWEKKKQETGAP